MPEIVKIAHIVTTGRIRSDLGDIDGLCSSIREFSLIEPIVLIREECTVEEDLASRGERMNSSEVNVLAPSRTVLVAGGRRITALKRLGWKELVHGQHFIWREEKLTPSTPEIALKVQAMEIEENVRRKDLSWQEQVLGQRRLLEIMQRIHGVAKSGAPTRGEKRHGEVKGFGVNKLAAMLGMSAAKVSEDIKLANAIVKIPQMAYADSKESAKRRLTTLGTIVSMKKSGEAAALVAATATIQSANSSDEGSAVVAPAKPWVLYEGEFHDNSKVIEDATVDLVYTDLPFGVDLSKMSNHNKGGIDYEDSRVRLLSDLPIFAIEAFRILRDNRYAVFWFGFNYYSELVAALRAAGFRVNLVPFVWFKNSRSTENPNTSYGNSYDPALVAMKGNPVFIKPGMTNFISLPQPTGSDKLQIAQQPVELVTRFLTDMVVSDAVVVDMCAGSGTTGVAAVKYGCRVVMFERDRIACELIKARMGVLR